MSIVVPVGSEVNGVQEFEERPIKSDVDRVPVSSMPTENVIPFSIATRCVAEFIAVMLFVLVGSLQAVTVGDGVLHAALCHGIAIVVLVTTFAQISGGHVNPAVTLGVAAAGRMPPIEAAFYIIAQLAGGILGAMVVRAILDYNQYVAIQAGATLCGVGINWHQGLLAEILTTYFLVQTVLVAAVDQGTVLAPLAIGFTVLTDILAAGGISGASMNPARSLGPNLVGSMFMNGKLADRFWSQHWIYYIGPAIGAVVAAAVYRAFFARESRMVK